MLEKFSKALWSQELLFKTQIFRSFMLKLNKMNFSTSALFHSFMLLACSKSIVWLRINVRWIRLIKENISNTNNMTRKRVKNFSKRFEGKNFCQKVPNFTLYCTNHIKICHLLAEVFAFKVLLKTFDTFSSPVIDIKNIFLNQTYPTYVDS